MLERKPHSLYILGLTGIWHMIHRELDGKIDDLNLIEERYQSALDWIMLEYLDRYLRTKSMSLSGHYRDDDGKTLLSLLPDNAQTLCDYVFHSRLSHFQSGRVTALISGYDLIISKELL